MDEQSTNNVKGALYDVKGKLVKSIDFLQPSIAYSLDLTDVAAGVYNLVLQAGNEKVSQKVIKNK
jgi:hypothetical protein